MKISNHLLIRDQDDCEILKNVAYPVNMRLYKSSSSYRDVVLNIIKYMDEHLNSSFDDWKNPIGIAAPNLGFSLRIIGYKLNSNNDEKFQFCLNPIITYLSPVITEGQGNCGSLQLKEPVPVARHNTINFEYYDLAGNLTTKNNVTRFEGGFTVQNLVDQLNGISVLDKVKK